MKKLLIVIFLIILPSVLLSETIKGERKINQYTDPYLTKIFDGPRLPEVLFSKIQQSFPEDTIGAYYRVGFLVYEIYTSFSIELIGFGEEGSGKKVVTSYFLNGFDVAGKIGARRIVGPNFIRWVGPKTFLIQLFERGQKEINFSIEIQYNGIFGIKVYD